MRGKEVSELLKGLSRTNRKRRRLLPLFATTLFLGLVTALSFQRAVATTNVVGEWHLDQGSGGSGTLISDSSGNGNDGTLWHVFNQQAAWTSGALSCGSAIDFDGVTYVVIPDSSSLRPPQVSLEAMVNHSGPPGQYRYIAVKTYLAGWGSYALYSGASALGGLQFYVGHTGGFILSPDAGPGVWDGQWHHVVGTYDGSTVRLYVDGNEIGNGETYPVNIGYNNGNFTIGNYGASLFFPGLIDEVRVWDTVLTLTEIQQLGSCAPSNTTPVLAVDQTAVSVDEGQTAINGGSVSDADGDSVVLTATVGTITNNNDGTWSWSRLTSDGPAESQTVTITADDGNGGTAVTDFTLVVNNVAPQAVFDAPANRNEGDTYSLSLLDASDPSSADSAAGFEYAFDCGDGSGLSAFSGSNQVTCSTDDHGSRSVGGQIRDKDGGLTEYTATFTIENIAPTAVFSNTTGAIDEGQSATLTFAAQYDPSPIDTAAGFTYSYDCEDNGSFEASDVAASSYDCPYPDDSPFTVRGRIKDKDGGYSDYTLGVIVNNVPPEIGPITAPIDPVLLNTEISASAVFTDVGVLDSHTAEWDWGDGTITAGYVSETDGSGTITGTHYYTQTGVYTVVLTASDDDGGSGQSVYEYVVIYDPEGGFVTGGGWIYSPEGAYMPDPSLTGMANFGFVSKYKKGANVPAGTTQFRFKAGDLDFVSDNYQWLVVNQDGTNAQFKGEGMINEELAPNGALYQFMIWAGDLDPDDDTFRIRIWYEENGAEVDVYDNGFDQPIGGGNIQIHQS